MTCQDAREILISGFPSALTEPERTAHEHVQGCQRCQLYLREQARLVQRLRGLPVEKPSGEFKEKLFTQISRLRWERSERKRKTKFRWAACIAGAVLVLTLLVRVWSPERPLAPLVDYLVEDHQQNLPGRFMLSSSSPAEIEAWFEGKLDFSYRMNVPAGMEVMGARLCRVEDARAALVFYRCRSHIISWFTFPETGRTAQAAREPSAFAAKGYNLILWRKGGLVHAVVSDLDEKELMSMLQTPHWWEQKSTR